MRHQTAVMTIAVVFVTAFCTVAAGQTSGIVEAWGDNEQGECEVVDPSADFTAVAGGNNHSLGLKNDGSVVAWGYNYYGQCDVPLPNTDYVAVAAGWHHSLAVLNDGAVVAWGRNNEGQCDAPIPSEYFVDVAAGLGHSYGIKDYAGFGGPIEAWGNNTFGQCSVPDHIDYVDVASGYYHGLGLRANGQVETWGRNDDGQCNVPAPNSDFIAVAAGAYHSVGLKSDGSLVTWGLNDHGQCDVPAPNTGFVVAAAGYRHSMGLKGNGSIVTWGSDALGQCTVPLPNEWFITIGAGWDHSLAIRACTPPEITEHPVNAAVCAGDVASFSVTATGTPTLHYAWTVDGTLAGDDAPILTFEALLSDEGAEVVCLVSNACGEVTSDAAVLTVYPGAPSIISQPSDAIAADGGSASFTVTADGTGPLHYQWYLDGGAVGDNTNVLLLEGVGVGFNGAEIVCDVTDDCGTTSSDIAILTVLPDTDGDGVHDALDLCNNTPPGTVVDAEGRPLGDIDQDCDTDVDDFALFQQGFTGPFVTAVTIETVGIGNAGNEPDTRYETPGYGGVDYAYNIGKYEVTAGQYAEFLNAVAATDTYSLYNTGMADPAIWTLGCNIQRTGSPGSYTYSVGAEWAQRPVNYISWGDAARFCNWLHNGQPRGTLTGDPTQDAWLTEDGSYYLNGAMTDAALMVVSRNDPGATWVIPTEDEWYKAAYYNDGMTGNYFNYPTSSDAVPGFVNNDGDLNETGSPFIEGGPDPGNYATYDGDGGLFEIGIGSPYYRTEVGEWENSGSPFGTFDQGGNVLEWNETNLFDVVRGIRGGSYRSHEGLLHAEHGDGNEPTYEDDPIGFRVAEIP